MTGSKGWMTLERIAKIISEKEALTNSASAKEAPMSLALERGVRMNSALGNEVHTNSASAKEVLTNLALEREARMNLGSANEVRMSLVSAKGAPLDT